jgi:hypothetical protein
MANLFLIVGAAVAAVIFLLVTASMFGVSRRAVEAEMRRAEGRDHDVDSERRDDLAA